MWPPHVLKKIRPLRVLDGTTRLGVLFLYISTSDSNLRSRRTAPPIHVQYVHNDRKPEVKSDSKIQSMLQ